MRISPHLFHGGTHKIEEAHSILAHFEREQVGPLSLEATLHTHTTASELET